jgi:hypothetical protein
MTSKVSPVVKARGVRKAGQPGSDYLRIFFVVDYISSVCRIFVAITYHYHLTNSSKGNV